MSKSGSTIDSLLAKISQFNPDVFEALRLMNQNLEKVYNDVFPPAGSVVAANSAAGVLVQVTNFVLTQLPNNLRFTWDLQPTAVSYEIRIGSTFDLGQHVITVSASQANLDPIALNLVYGSYTFTIKPIDADGDYGIVESTATLLITQIPAPTLTATVIANTAFLSWTVPTTQWAIDHYRVYKNGTEVGRVFGTFKVQAELVGGTYNYTVKAFDIVGDISTVSNTLTLTLSGPVDYTNIATVMATYGGTYSNTRNITYSGQNGILGSYPTKTWQHHFLDEGYTKIKDQTDAAFPLFFQPANIAATTGTYREVFDLGSIFTNVNVYTAYNKIQLSGTTAITIQMEASDDNITYAAPVSGDTNFFTHLRYVRVTYTFTNTDRTSAAFIYGVYVSANAQYTVDSGSVSALASDVSGTLVTFNITYKAAPQVTDTALTNISVTTVFNAATTTTARVFCYDSTGNRIDKTVNWKTRGVV